MKSNTRKVLLGASTIAALAVYAAPNDANAATTKVKITAQIIKAVSITQTSTLKFGKLTQSKTTVTGTLVVDATADTRTAAGSVKLVGGNAASHGGFQMKGITGQKINVTGPLTTQITNGANKLVVDKFTINGAAGTIKNTAFTHSLAAVTETDFKVGGRLNLPAAAVATGTYSGTVTLTANYN